MCIANYLSSVRLPSCVCARQKMGLMLSILIAAIGVVELLAFYDRVLDNVRSANSAPKQDLIGIRSYYVRSLREGEVDPRRRSLSHNPSINISEVDEDVYSDASESSRSASPEPETRIPRQGLFPPSRKSKSRSSCSTSRSVSPLPFREPGELEEIPLESPIRNSESLLKVEGVQRSPSGSEIVDWKRSPSPFQKLLLEEHEDVRYDEQIDTGDLPLVKVSNCEEVEEQQGQASTSSSEAGKTLEEAAKILSGHMEGQQEKPEPFWVK